MGAIENRPIINTAALEVMECCPPHTEGTSLLTQVKARREAQGKLHSKHTWENGR